MLSLSRFLHAWPAPILVLLVLSVPVAAGVQRVEAVSPDVVISQVYGGGGNSGATYTHDFIELFNRGPSSVALTGWSVQYAAATGSTWQKTDLTGVIQPGRYYLVREAQGAGGSVPLPTPDALGAISMSASSAKVALVTSTTLLTCGTAPGDCLSIPSIRDFVGYGSTANNFEGGGPTATLTNTTAALRALGGCTDTDQNGTDFATGPPNPRNGSVAVNSCGAPASTVTPTPTLGVVRIHTIQGAGHLSPLVGVTVADVEGLVTAKRSNGFYLQDPAPDADDRTSEGIFVFTSSAPIVAVGDLVAVSGMVSEFRSGCALPCTPSDSGYPNLATTEITTPTVAVLSSGNPLPTPVVIGAGGRVPPGAIIDDDASGNVETSGSFDPSTDGIDFYEALEGMRVQINNAVAVGPRSTFAEIPVLPDLGTGASVRTLRGGIVIQAADFNPERIILDDGIVSTPSNVKVGDSFPGATMGVVDYTFGNFKVLATSWPPVTAGGLAPETTSAAGANQLAVATFNLENLDPGDGPSKFNALATQIVQNLQSPDLLAVQEVQDNNGATNDATVDASTTYGMLIAAIQGAGGPTYEFRDIPPVDGQDGGEPGGNIRVGFLFRADRGLGFMDRPGGGPTLAVSVVNGPSGPELSFSPGRIEPGNTAFSQSRKPLVGEFRYNGQTLFVINNHLLSRGGDDPLFGRFQPPTLSSEAKRIQQALVVRNWVNELLDIDPNARVIVLGDLNDFDFSTVLMILKGSGLLHNLTETLPVGERYSYVFEGNSQALDHVLVSTRLLGSVASYDVVHINAEFIAQTSDHDPPRVLLLLAGSTTPTSTATQTTTATSTPTLGATATGTRTPTTTGTATRTATASLSPTLTPGQTLILTPSRTPTFVVTSTPPPTPTFPTTSGRSLALESQIGVQGVSLRPQAATDHLLTWTSGTLSHAVLVRWDSASGLVLLPTSRGQPPFGPGVGSYLDTDLLANSAYCYVLFAYQGSVDNPQQPSRSDLLCVLPGTYSTPLPPGRFRIWLNDSTTASLSWTAPGGQERYILAKTNFGMLSPLFEELAGNRTSFAEDIGTHATCYRLVAYIADTELGATETLCAVPGMSSFTSPG